MKGTKKSWLPALLAAGLSVAAIASAASSGWVVVSSPNPEVQNFLDAVGGVSATDVWTVGYEADSNYDLFTLAEHWDGTSWTAILTPSPGSTLWAPLWQNVLYGVAAASSNDVWSVGTYCGPGQPGNETLDTLIEHWDGTEWAVVPSPSPSSSCSLTGVVALSANNVWAVGQNYGAALPQTLVEHWNGATWSIVPSQNPVGRTAYLGAVAAVSSTDIWAVGYSGASSDPYLIPLIEHYDGHAWKIVPSPYVPQSRFNQLNAVTAVSANDVWAVGYQNANSKGQDGQGLIEHWNGTTWSLVSSPVAGDVTYLNGISATSSASVWAVGYILNNILDTYPVIEHWNGTVWTVVPSPSPGEAAQMYAAASMQGKIWAVGAYSTIQAGAWLDNPQTLTMAK